MIGRAVLMAIALMAAGCSTTMEPAPDPANETEQGPTSGPTLGPPTQDPPPRPSRTPPTSSTPSPAPAPSLPGNVSFSPTIQVKTYVWVPEPELQALLPAGWDASCHEYFDGRCAFEGHVSEVTIEYFTYDVARIGNQTFPAGEVAAVLLNTEPPEPVAQSRGDIMDVDWILAGLHVTSQDLLNWLDHHGVPAELVDDQAIGSTSILEPGVGAWHGTMSVEGTGIDLVVEQPNVGYLLPVGNDNNGRIYIGNATVEPSHYIRHVQQHEAFYPLSRGRGLAQGTIDGFSGSEWKDDHAWLADPSPIEWIVQTVAADLA